MVQVLWRDGVSHRCADRSLSMTGQQPSVTPNTAPPRLRPRPSPLPPPPCPLPQSGSVLPTTSLSTESWETNRLACGTGSTLHWRHHGQSNSYIHNPDPLHYNWPACISSYILDTTTGVSTMTVRQGALWTQTSTCYPLVSWSWCNLHRRTAID